jgi:hypothetical protein
MSSPTSRSLEDLRDRGYTAEVVEKWIPATRRRKDLFGFGDILALRPGEVTIVQTTSDDNVAARISKIQEAEHLPAVRAAGVRILVHGWRKVGRRWRLREVDVS